jgi:glycosyltransferase involved in cell wall biosynthesis
MKVLVISGAFPPMRAGEADHAWHLCHRLSARGVDIHVLTSKQNEQKTDLPFRVYPIMRDWSWRDLPRLGKFMKMCSPDAVLLLYSGGPIYNKHPMITFAATLSKILIRRATFVTQLEVAYATISATIFTRAAVKAVSTLVGSARVDYVLGTLLSRSDRILVLSEHHRSRLVSRLPHISDRVSVVPPPPILRMSPEHNGATRQRVRCSLGVDQNDFLMGYFGYIYSNKGIETLFEALRLLSQRRSDVRLVMIGGNSNSPNLVQYQRKILALADQLGISDRIKWTGEYDWDSEEGSVYLRATDACVFPFTRGVTLNRSSVSAAAAHGLPIITTRGEVLESPFVDGKNMLLCAPNDPLSLAQAMEAVMDNGVLRQHLRDGALELARHCFSWDGAVERTVHALNGADLCLV